MYSRINLQLVIIRWLELYFYAAIKRHVNHTATVDLRQHNKLNEITSRKIGDNTKVLFAYDGTTGASNGNLADDGTLQLSYDALNRLIQVKRKSNGQTIGQYVYDALNRRTRKTISNGGLSGDIPNGTTDYLYQDWQIVEERSGSTVNKQYVWGSYIDECIQLKTLTTTGPQSLPTGDYYPLQDLLYRTTALADDEGDIVEAYDYDAYGNTLIFSAAGPDGNWWADDATQANYAACEVLYCGYRFDPEAQTYQVRNREYYPMLGRWLQRDPIGFDGEDWNLYGYVRDNPVNMVDPYGLETYDQAWAMAELALVRKLDSGSFKQAIRNHSDSGRFDYKNRLDNDNDIILFDGNRWSPADFGNYTAGYGGYWQAGEIGVCGVKAGGHWYAAGAWVASWIDALAQRDTSVRQYYHAPTPWDEPRSRTMIHYGAVRARRQFDFEQARAAREAVRRATRGRASYQQYRQHLRDMGIR